MRTLDELLVESPVFAGLDRDELALVAGCGTNVVFAAGERLFREGDAAETFFLVRHGLVALDAYVPTNGQIAVDTVGPGEIVGYWINRHFMFMGRWLRHAYYPNWNLRLFRHSLGRYEKLTDAPTNSGDNEVHEHVIVRGPTGKLRCQIDHYAFPSVEAFIEKHNRYSNWEARVAVDRFLAGSARAISSDRVGSRRKLKRLSQHLPFRPLLRFFYVYVWQRGFLDGREGYYFARLHAVYEFLSVAKTYELKKKQARE